MNKKEQELLIRRDSLGIEFSELCSEFSKDNNVSGEEMVALLFDRLSAAAWSVSLQLRRRR